VDAGFGAIISKLAASEFEMSDKFKQFIMEQAAQADGDAERLMSIEEEKDLWLAQLQRLISFIEKSLVDYVTLGGIATTITFAKVTEEQIGTYDAPQLEISVGHSSVKLKPIGTFLVGAWGRVDMEGPRGICRFALVPKSAKTLAFAFNSNPPLHLPGDLAWKIMPTPPAVEYVELTEELFFDLFMKIVRGG